MRVERNAAEAADPMMSRAISSRFAHAKPGTFTNTNSTVPPTPPTPMLSTVWRVGTKLKKMPQYVMMLA